MNENSTSLEPGRAWPLGTTWDDCGVNFALFSANAERVELCLFDDDGHNEKARILLPECTDQVWHGYLPDAKPGLLYGYRVHAPYLPEQGYRFNANKLLLDPYAKAYSGEFQPSGRHLGYRAQHPDGDLSFDARDNAAQMPKCRVVADEFDWEDDRPPATALADTVIYEAHVKGFTRRHPGVPERLRGTYAGFGHPAAVEHLQRLGITAVELLPVHAFLDEGHLLDRGLSNYWGYNSYGFFAPTSRYADTEPVDEFKTLVKRLHAAGIEVILDVVYNHTAEGNHCGPTLSFRGIDNASYYWLLPDNPRYYDNHTGCGNTLNLDHPRVVQMVMDSLRYWVREMHVDGFRFDLATSLARKPQGYDAGAGLLTAMRQDPTLAGVKWIAEPWDVGPGGYQAGRFPPGWSEWNDRFRDDTRRFWLLRDALPAELAERLAGSSDMFKHSGRQPQASVNFVTAHDGFSLQDVVSYSHKHNEANGEKNDDGHEHEVSHNGGVEGETDDEAIMTGRRQLKRNLLATMMLSQGVPMLLAGDEFGHTQGGNNNTYCQDNETAWLNWEAIDETLLEFTRRLIRLRQAHPSLRRTRWLEGEPLSGMQHDVVWVNRHGTEKTVAQWENPKHHGLGFLLGATADEPALLVLINAEPEPVDYTLPEGEWALLLDTSMAEPIDAEQPITDTRRRLAGSSLSLLRQRDG